MAVAFNKMGRVWRHKGDLHLALEYLERGLDLFQQAGDARGVAGSLDLSSPLPEPPDEFVRRVRFLSLSLRRTLPFPFHFIS